MGDVGDLPGQLLRIWKDVAEHGEPLPSEDSLASSLGVSRPAVREALIRMEADGLVRRQQGAGTFTNPAALDMPVRLDRASELADRITGAGMTATVELLDAQLVTIDAGDVPLLDAPPGTPALRTLKRWRADGVPAMVAADLVVLGRHAGDPVGEASCSVITLCEAVGVGRPEWLCTWPTAVTLDAELAELLELPPGAASLQLEQVGVDRHGRRVFHALEHHRPGVLRYGLIRTMQ